MSTHIVACLLLYRHRQVSLAVFHVLSTTSFPVDLSLYLPFFFFFSPSVTKISTPPYVFLNIFHVHLPFCPSYFPFKSE